MTGVAKQNDLARRNALLDEDVRQAVERKREDVASRELPPLASYALPGVIARISDRIAAAGLDPSKVPVGPPTGRLPEGTPPVDLAFNVASAAKPADRHPVQAAEAVAESLGELDDVAEAFSLGPFVNVRLDRGAFAASVFDDVGRHGERYGWHRDGDTRLVVIDYSHPNIAKNMTVAHLRSTIIGHALYKIHEADGWASFSVNHLGDWGTQFGKLLFEYRKEHAADATALEAELESNPTGALMRLYREFVEREESDPVASEEARRLFLELESGDAELVELWTRFREWSMKDFADVYGRLRVDFDAYQGESFYEDRMAEVVEEGLDRGVLERRPDGAVVFPPQPLFDPMADKWLDSAMRDQNGGPRPEIVLKPSGGTVYLTRDLAAIKYRMRVLEADQLLYVVGKEQRVHLLVLFNIAAQLGYVEHGQALHTAFGHLNFHGRKMKSRSGHVVLLTDLLDEAIGAATALAEEHGGDELDADGRAEVARMVGTGSLIYNDLRQDRQTDIEFDPDVAATLEAGQGPYIQYAYARLRGISKRIGDEGANGGGATAPPDELHPAETDVVFQLAAFPQVVAEAAERKAPHRVATYVNRLAQLTNVFYHAVPVKDASGAERAFRLRLVHAAETVFENAAFLLHMELPEQM